MKAQCTALQKKKIAIIIMIRWLKSQIELHIGNQSGLIMADRASTFEGVDKPRAVETNVVDRLEPLVLRVPSDVFLYPIFIPSSMLSPLFLCIHIINRIDPGTNPSS